MKTSDKNILLLDIRNNYLTELPDYLTGLKSLVDLKISGNKISPDYLSEFKKSLPSKITTDI